MECLDEIIVYVIFPLLGFSNDFCFTSGDCQNRFPETRDSLNCYIIKTGSDALGNITCTRRCFSAQLGSYCYKFEGRAFGICRDELPLPFPEFNPSDPNRCSAAIDFHPYS